MSQMSHEQEILLGILSQLGGDAETLGCRITSGSHNVSHEELRQEIQKQVVHLEMRAMNRAFQLASGSADREWYWDRCPSCDLKSAWREGTCCDSGRRLFQVIQEVRRALPVQNKPEEDHGTIVLSS